MQIPSCDALSCLITAVFEVLGELVVLFIILNLGKGDFPSRDMPNISLLRQAGLSAAIT